MTPSFPLARAAVPAAALALLAAAPSATHACSSCGCTLNADWPTQGLGNGPGWSVDLRHDFFVQDQLRTGARAVDRGAVPIPNADEVQQKTVNRNTTLTIDRALGDDAGVSVILPWLTRVHTTIDAGETDPSGSRSSSIGDVRVVARWQGFTPEHDIGVQFGLKLPTGATNVDFSSGPTSGERLDAGLQPGTGTTDLLLGAYAFGDVGPSFDGYAQAMLQLPLGSHAGFRPGAGLNATLGLRLSTSGPLVPHLQLNVRSERPETGDAADAPNSGATLAYLSPGATWRVASGWNVYGFAQVPVWQNVRGVQLEPRWSVSAGVQARF
jgi:hypothetical protein